MWRMTEHQRVGEAIERRHGADVDPWLDVLAYQFEQSAELYGPDRAIDYLRRAGRRAEGQRGNEHAVGFYRRALTLVEPAATGSGRLRCELMIELGNAERRSGQGAARRTLLEATSCAIAIEDAPLATQAVLGSGRGIFSLAGSVDTERVAALREVLSLLGPERTEQRARVLAALSAELIFDDDPTAAHEASDEALSIARERGDPATLVTTLGLRLVALWTPDQVQQRLQLGAELDEFRRLAGSRRSGQFLSAMTLYCQAAMEVVNWRWPINCSPGSSRPPTSCASRPPWASSSCASPPAPPWRDASTRPSNWQQRRIGSASTPVRRMPRRSTPVSSSRSGCTRDGWARCST